MFLRTLSTGRWLEAKFPFPIMFRRRRSSFCVLLVINFDFNFPLHWDFANWKSQHSRTKKILFLRVLSLKSRNKTQAHFCQCHLKIPSRSSINSRGCLNNFHISVTSLQATEKKFFSAHNLCAVDGVAIAIPKRIQRTRNCLRMTKTQKNARIIKKLLRDGLRKFFPRTGSDSRGNFAQRTTHKKCVRKLRRRNRKVRRIAIYIQIAFN